MKKKLYLLVLCPFLIFYIPARSQNPRIRNIQPLNTQLTTDTTTWFGKMDYTFQFLDKSQITTGILRDYGIDFQNPDNFSGAILHDSNWVNLADWRTLYATLYSGQINTNASMLALDTVNRIISKYAADTLPIAFVSLYYKYQVLDTNAATENLLTVTNQQLYDVPGRTQSPYLMRSSFAIAAVAQALHTGNNSFIFRSDLIFGNTGKTISAIQVDPTGSGTYQTVSLNTPFTINYADTGLYAVTVKISYTDGTINYSHTKFAVYTGGTGGVAFNDPFLNRHKGSGPPYISKHADIYSGAEFIVPLTAAKTYLGVAATGQLQVDLAQSNTTGQIRKPLIVVEGFDQSTDGTGYNIYDYLNAINADPAGNPISLNADLDDHNDYDLIFVYWHNGTDYIERNAYLVETAIAWVNANKTTYNGAPQQNVIIGLSMGGLCVRYALRDMELNNQSHDCRLFVSHDAPHWGANVPVGISAMAQDLGSWMIYKSGFSNINYTDLFPDIAAELTVFNSPAAKEMLIQRYILNTANGSLTADNSTHAAFMSEMAGMGWPLNCKNITLSNGACNGAATFTSNAQFLAVQGNYSLGSYFDQMAISAGLSFTGLFFPALNLVITGGTVHVNDLSLLIQYPLSILSSSASTNFDFGAWAVPNSGTGLIFRGNISIKRTILFFNVTSYLIKCNASSTPDMLPLDNAPGGVYDMNEFVNVPNINQQLQSRLGTWIRAIVRQPQFCFVPTVSSLGLSNAQQNLFTNICSNINCLNPAGVANYYTPTANQDHITYDQASTNWLIQNIAPTYNCAKYCPSALSINGDAGVCSGPSNPYSITGLPLYASVLWSVPPASVTVNTPNAVQTTLTPTSAYGPFTLTATLSNGCAAMPTTILTKPLTTGVPISPAPGTYAATNCYYNVEVNVLAGVTSVQISGNGTTWNDIALTYNSSCNCQLGFITGSVEGPVTLTYWTRAKYNDVCGYCPGVLHTVKVPAPRKGSCGLVVGPVEFDAYPNPASGTVTVVVSNTGLVPARNGKIVTAENSAATPAAGDASIRKITLLSADGKVVKEYNFSNAGNQTTIDVSNLASGSYFIKVDNASGSAMKTLVIKH